jgi:drug/metabolite transporter (DMT)-like permease
MDSSNILLVICVFIWGLTTFMQKLSADKMSPILMQVIIGVAFFIFVPIAIKVEGGLSNLKWNTTSVVLSFIAAFLSILANVLMYSALSNNKHTGSSVMLISLYPAVTLILSAIFLHEQFSSGKMLGFLAMVIGACLLTFC